MHRPAGLKYGFPSVIALITLALLYGLNCSSKSSPSGPGSGGAGTQTYVLSLGHGATDIQVHANQTEYFQMTYQVPPGLGNIQEVEVDVAASLKHVSVAVPLRPSSILQALSSLWKNGFDSSAVVYLRVGLDPSTVCTDGLLIGPRSVSATSFLSPAPETATLDASIIQLLNTGTLAICAEITSTVDATFSIDSVTATVTQAECEAAANFAGTWKGPFTCGNSCGGPFSDTVTLTVTQNGLTATYSDGYTIFAGDICGDRFTFSSVASGGGETETGTMTLLPNGTAVKSSTWESVDPTYCTGDCFDTLTRISTH